MRKLGFGILMALLSLFVFAPNFTKNGCFCKVCVKNQL